MLFRPHRLTAASGSRGRITVLAALAALAAVAVPAGPAGAVPEASTSSGGSAAPGTRSTGTARMAARVTDPDLAAKALGVTPEQAAALDLVCSQAINGSAGTVTPDVRLEETVTITFTGTVNCTTAMERISGDAGLFDRTPPAVGEVFDGQVLRRGSRIDAAGTAGSSTGSYQASAFTYNGARRVQPFLELTLDGPPGFTWAGCEPQAGLTILTCEGAGTNVLHMVTGAGVFDTKLTKACRDFSASLGIEEARLYRTPASGGAAPASTGMVLAVPEVAAELMAFRRDLCATGTADALTFVRQRGQRLWDVATERARSGNADDRPLYWARLGMVVAIRQWVPPGTMTPAQIEELIRQLEFTSRGMDSVSFTGTGKRLFVSGYDPFGLDIEVPTDGIFNTNESGASVLRLDGRNLPGVQVQAVIFPVRYKEFDERLVESVFGPMLRGGADTIVSISEGVNNQQGDHELEVYYGRNRSTGPDFPDNNGVDTPGTFFDPEPPLNIDAGPEFTTSSLKVDVIDNAAATTVDRHVWEIRGPDQSPEMSTTGPTAGSISVQGSGGGYLSNEIAYRVTRLRDAISSTVPTGHLHVPGSDGTDANRLKIANQCATILRVAALA